MPVQIVSDDPDGFRLTVALDIPLQAEGAAFLAARKFAGLFDEQGSGKTFQAIRACDIVKRKHNLKDFSPLVIAPPSHCDGWFTEFEEFSQEGIRPRVISWGDITNDFLFRHLSDQRFSVLIPDEAHRAKTLESQRSLAVWGDWSYRGGQQVQTKPGWVSLADRVWPLTGTPMPNHNGELFPMIRALWPDALGPYQTWDLFSRRYVVFRKIQKNPFHKPRLAFVKNINTAELRERFAPNFLRRTLSEIDASIPPMEMKVLRLDAAYALPANYGTRSEFNELKADALDAAQSDDQDEGALSLMRHRLGIFKAHMVADFVACELGSGALDSVVLFSWHSEVAKILARRLERFGVVSIVGATPKHKRQGIARQFQNDRAIRVFNGNMQAAGEAITLTRAARAIFAEYSFSPLHMSQASKRIRRISQKRKTLCQIAALRDSFDEKNAEILARKTAGIREMFAD